MLEISFALEVEALLGVKEVREVREVRNVPASNNFPNGSRHKFLTVLTVSFSVILRWSSVRPVRVFPHPALSDEKIPSFKLSTTYVLNH